MITRKQAQEIRGSSTRPGEELGLALNNPNRGVHDEVLGISTSDEGGDGDDDGEEELEHDR